MFDTLFPIIFGIFFCLGLVFILVTFVRIGMARRKMRAMGFDPYTDGPMALHNIGAAAGRMAQSSEDRLRELDGLRKQGLITAEEYDAKRAQIINDL